MNVLIIPSWYNTDENPTNGSFFRDQALALKNAGHSVVVAFIEVVSTETTDVKELNDNGIQTYRLKQKKIKKTGNIGTILAYSRGLNKIIKTIEDKYKFDIIHLHSSVWAGYATAKISRKYKIPFIITEHSSYFGRYKSNIIEKYIFKYVFRNAQKVISVSNALKKEIEVYNNDIVVIPNMVNCEIFGVDNIIEQKGFTFLSLCYLKKNKNIDVLIKAFHKYFKGINCKLIIAGDGPERLFLEKLANDLQIDDKVIFKGPLTRKEVVNIINYSDVMVLPSNYETFGVVLIEALACGKPVISTYNGGAEDIIDESNGKIVEKNNYDALGNAMIEIYYNYSRYNKSEIIKCTLERYNNSNVVKKIEDIYLEIVRK